MQHVDPVDLPVIDACSEVQDGPLVGSVLTDVTEVLEYLDHSAEDEPQGLFAVIRLEHDRRMELHIYGEHREQCFEVMVLDRFAERFDRHVPRL